MSAQSCDCSSLFPRSMSDQRNMILLGVRESCLHADVFLFLRKRKYLLEVIPENILNQNKNKANLWLAEVMFNRIGHFRVPKTLTFKMRLGAQLNFFLHENEN